MRFTVKIFILRYIYFLFILLNLKKKKSTLFTNKYNSELIKTKLRDYVIQFVWVRLLFVWNYTVSIVTRTNKTRSIYVCVCVFVNVENYFVRMKYNYAWIANECDDEFVTKFKKKKCRVSVLEAKVSESLIKQKLCIWIIETWYKWCFSNKF